jgi:hypothetical protein
MYLKQTYKRTANEAKKLVVFFFKEKYSSIPKEKTFYEVKRTQTNISSRRVITIQPMDIRS